MGKVTPIRGQFQHFINDLKEPEGSFWVVGQFDVERLYAATWRAKLAATHFTLAHYPFSGETCLPGDQE
ncbi:MAG: hypothetical protein ACRD2B_09405 [Terriglobia bacterium]